jgi:hypothetical protein
VKNPLAKRPFRICKDGWAIPMAAISIPPTCDNCIAVESGIVVVRRIADNTVAFRRRVGYARGVNVSDDGLFVSVWLFNGELSVFQLCQENKVPVDFTLVHRFSFLSEITWSAISSQDFLVAVALPGRISISNFATALLHREIVCSETVLTLLYDSFEGILTVVFRTSVVQYSVNGNHLRTLAFDREVTAACVFGFDSRFDARLLIVGHDDGTLSFCIVSEAFELRPIFVKKVHTRRCASLYCDTTSGLLWSCDDHGGTACVDFCVRRHDGPQVKCQFCPAPMAGRCRKCQLPVCERCAPAGLCPNDIS